MSRTQIFCCTQSSKNCASSWMWVLIWLASYPIPTPPSRWSPTSLRIPSMPRAPPHNTTHPLNTPPFQRPTPQPPSAPPPGPTHAPQSYALRSSACTTTPSWHPHLAAPQASAWLPRHEPQSSRCVYALVGFWLDHHRLANLQEACKGHVPATASADQPPRGPLSSSCWQLPSPPLTATVDASGHYAAVLLHTPPSTRLLVIDINQRHTLPSLELRWQTPATPACSLAVCSTRFVLHGTLHVCMSAIAAGPRTGAGCWWLACSLTQ